MPKTRIAAGQTIHPGPPPGDPAATTAPKAGRTKAAAQAAAKSPAPDAYGPSTTASQRAPGVAKASVDGAPVSTRFDAGDLPIGAARAAALAADFGRWGKAGAPLVTASSVEAAVDRAGDAVPAWLLQRIADVYGKDGPLGPSGPLGALGPVGRHPWNPSQWMKATTEVTGEWTGLAQRLAEAGGPGGEQGSLGPDGPVGKRALLKGLAAELEAGGLLGGVGPASALGALGPLGYAGQIGGHGHGQNRDGEFLGPGGKVARTIQVPYGESTREVELVEYYRADFAKQLEDNDSSWMVRSSIDPSKGAKDVFPFNARAGEIVTLTAVPEHLNDTVTLELLDQQGKVVATSDSDKYVNFIQIQVPEGQKLSARVSLKKSEDASHPVAAAIAALLAPTTFWFGMMSPWLGDLDNPTEPHTYRLICTPGTPAVTDPGAKGDVSAAA